MAREKEKERPTLRARVASKFSHEDEPEEEKAPTKKTKMESKTPEEPAKTYSVGAGAPPHRQKALNATIERDRKELKKKQI